MSSQFITQKQRPDHPAARFATFITDGCAALSGLSPSHGYPAGVELFRQGAVSDQVYFIDHGLIKLTSLCESGRELIVCLRSPGWLLGVTSLILQRPNPFQATTLTYCQLRRFPADVFFDTLTNNVGVACFIEQALSREAYEQITPTVELGCCSARHRLERFLWMLVFEIQRPGPHEEMRLRMPLKHWEVAQMLAITPAYFSRLLNQMEGEKVIQRKNGMLIIPDPQKLWHDAAP